MSTSKDRGESLQHAGWALGLLADRVSRNAFGDIDGVDTLSIGLGALADPLADLLGFSRGVETTLEDVLAYATATGRVDQSAMDSTVQLREMIRRATYPGVSPEDLTVLNQMREELHHNLTELLEEASDE